MLEKNPKQQQRGNILYKVYMYFYKAYVFAYVLYVCF